MWGSYVDLPPANQNQYKTIKNKLKNIKAMAGFTANPATVDPSRLFLAQ